MRWVPDWRERQDDPEAWLALRHVPDHVLWDVRERLRGYLIEFMRMRARRCWSRERASGTRLVALGTLLDPSALTIGYAQPFGDGRGPELLFTDPTRLAQILTAARRPVQFVFAGRAHPADDAGKHHLQRLFRHALDPAFGGRLAFLEDYDLHVARLLVQGCDVWLGTPRRGAPALIGGIQAAVNGAPHLGSRDAWWPGGWTGHNGWIIEAAPAAIRPRARPRRRAPSTSCSRAGSCRRSTIASAAACRSAGCRSSKRRLSARCRNSARAA